MSTQDLLNEMESLPLIEKARIVDHLTREINRTDPEIDKVWADEAEKRWSAYKAGKIKAIPYEQVMEKYKIR